MVGMDVGDDDAPHAHWIYLRMEKLLNGAAATVHEDGLVLSDEDEGGGVSFEGGNRAGRAQEDEPHAPMLPAGLQPFKPAVGAGWPAPDFQALESDVAADEFEAAEDSAQHDQHGDADRQRPVPAARRGRPGVLLVHSLARPVLAWGMRSLSPRPELVQRAPRTALFRRRRPIDPRVENPVHAELSDLERG